MSAPPSPLRKNANFFDQIDYSAKAALFLISEALNARHQLETIMATVEELQAAIDANTAATDAASAAITTEIAQLQAAISALSTSAPPTQAQIDALNASTAKLSAVTAELAADDPAVTPAP